MSKGFDGGGRYASNFYSRLLFHQDNWASTPECNLKWHGRRTSFCFVLMTVVFFFSFV